MVLLRCSSADTAAQTQLAYSFVTSGQWKKILVGFVSVDMPVFIVYPR